MVKNTLAMERLKAVYITTHASEAESEEKSLLLTVDVCNQQIKETRMPWSTCYGVVESN